MATHLRYRGVSYDPAQHEKLSDKPVDHVYRGRHYEAATRHDVAPVDTEVELHYRGSVYHHRQAQAARELKQG
ncbi:MAG: DUF4278 domain-containing protein [Cyanobacteriota bacterium]|nr:DUF4278 domain-containing protein [Cyanobacteriota bacterium]